MIEKQLRYLRTSSQHEVVSIASNEDTDEDDDKDANFDQLMKNGKLENLSKKQIQQRQQQQQLPINEHTKFLGMNFLTKVLQERNKNPSILLWAFFVTSFVRTLMSFFTFIHGSHYNLIQCVLQPTQSLLITIVTIKMLQTPISELNKLPIKFRVCEIVSHLELIFMVLFAFLKATPFHKQYLYILSLFSYVFCNIFVVGLIAQKNKLSWDQNYYQFEFFISRIIFAFLASIGLVHVISEVVLGIDCVVQLQPLFIILGVILIVFCLADIVVFFQIIISPNTASLFIFILAVILEGLVLGTSIGIVVLYSDGTHGKNEIFEVGLVSILSTFVNLIYLGSLIVVKKMDEQVVEYQVQQINDSRRKSQQFRVRMT